jgi:hypothetical protein
VRAGFLFELPGESKFENQLGHIKSRRSFGHKSLDPVNSIFDYYQASGSNSIICYSVLCPR